MKPVTPATASPGMASAQKAIAATTASTAGGRVRSCAR
jgi:hypothetical protein